MEICCVTKQMNLIMKIPDNENYSCPQSPCYCSLERKSKRKPCRKKTLPDFRKCRSLLIKYFWSFSHIFAIIFRRAHPLGSSAALLLFDQFKHFFFRIHFSTTSDRIHQKRQDENPFATIKQNSALSVAIDFVDKWQSFTDKDADV